MAERTLAEDGFCVRCGAPDIHCMCPPVGPDGHWWVEPDIGVNRTPWVVCMKCGAIRRADGLPSSQCRGPVRVALRGAAAVQEATDG